MKSIDNLLEIIKTGGTLGMSRLVRVYTGRNVVSNVNVIEALQAATHEIERELSEEYIELPKDMNGNRIRIGDTLHGHEDGNDFRVDGFSIWGDERFFEREWWAYQDNGPQYPVAKCTIVTTDSWENIEKDAKAWMNRHGTPIGVMTFIERCKALAGVDD